MSEIQTAQRRLGRGLNALLGGGTPATDEIPSGSSGELREIPLAKISRNPFQPRKDFNAESLGELASSIREHGVIQPIIVRELETGFQLVAGERRWQAAQKAGLTSIPCRIVDVIDKTACEFALEENLKRQDLNDLEKAQAFRDYIDLFECTVEELGKQVSMSRSAVANILRLLELPDPIKNALHAGRITAGAARALLPLEQADQLELASRIQAEKLSVRQIESIVKTMLNRDTKPVVETPPPVAETETRPAADDSSSPQIEPQGHTATAETAHGDPAVHQPTEFESTPQPAPVAEGQGEQWSGDASPVETIPMDSAEVARTAHIDSLEEQLRDLLGVKATIKLSGKDRGVITIPFSSNEEFERILKTVRRAAA